MTLLNIFLLVCIAAISLQFWRLRGISEFVIAFAKQYCQKENLQFLALARTNTTITQVKGQPDWKITYRLHFSSDGENEYIGTIEAIGKQITKVELPVYRINTG